MSFMLSSCATTRPQPVEFTTMIAHWTDYARPEYLKFVEDAQPDVAQVGFYGAHYWSLAHTPHGAGYPAHFPKVGLQENRAFFRQLNTDLHKRGAKVVGHFNIEFLVGDPESKEGPRGFFKFYRELWDEKLLGPKPVADPTQLLERNADGTLIVKNSYSIGGMKEYWACLNNPHWRAVLKAWVKHGIDLGLDGYVINYFYRHNCLCDHCQVAFRDYLRPRHTAVELEKQFGIANLAAHKFTEIVSWHDPAQSTPLRREMLRFSQIAIKHAFDEVFVKYGRSLKPGLILAQWNHLGNFSQISGDERCMLPGELWAKDEDYLWYSTGGAACYTDLPAGYLGEGTLQSRYLRGASGNKPFTLGKYENTRVRVAISELAANGGAPMGFYTRFTEPLARAEIVRYYQFIRKHAAIFRHNRSHAEALLVYPRAKVHTGDVAAVTKFRDMGDTLLNQHVLFDVLPDDLATPERLAGYGKVYRVDDPSAPVLAAARSTFVLPTTVRVSVSQPAEGAALHLHLVNYNRIEPEKKKSAGGGIKDEKPIAVKSGKATLQLPAGQQVKRVRFYTPEILDATDLKSQSADGRVTFDIPEFLVYGVVALELEPKP